VNQGHKKLGKEFSFILGWTIHPVKNHWTRWPPWSFTNPIWHSAILCLHWSAIMPLYFHLL